MEDQDNYKRKTNSIIYNWPEKRFINYIQEILSHDYDHIHRVSLEKGQTIYLVPEHIFDHLRLTKT